MIFASSYLYSNHYYKNRIPNEFNNLAKNTHLFIDYGYSRFVDKDPPVGEKFDLSVTEITTYMARCAVLSHSYTLKIKACNHNYAFLLRCRINH